MKLIPFCERSAENIIGIIEALTHHIHHDHYHAAGKHIRNHSGHCQTLMFRLAVAMGIEDDKELAAIMVGTYGHDIGKETINPFITGKDGKLTDREFDIMRQHVMWRNVADTSEGRLGIPWPSWPKWAVDCSCGHQQKNKGGYPSRSEFPFESYDLIDAMRIVDEFQAGFCRERPWRDPKSYEEMETDLRARAANGFLNAEIVEIFFGIQRQDVFHDENFRPIIQTKIIDEVGIISRKVYDRLLNFKAKTS